MPLLISLLNQNVYAIKTSTGTYMSDRKSIKNLSTLFDEYGPVVRFVSPVGGDIVLINHPDHIQKVYAMEGDAPVRSALDSLEKYRLEHRNHSYGGLFTVLVFTFNVPIYLSLIVEISYYLHTISNEYFDGFHLL